MRRARSRLSIDKVLFIYHGSLGVVLGILLIVIGNSLLEFIPFTREILNTLGSTLIVGSIFGILYTNISRNLHQEEIGYLLEREQSGLRRLYPQSEDDELCQDIISKLRDAKVVQMYGLACFNVLGKPEAVALLHDRAKRHRVRVTLLLADTTSTEIQQRLTEEEYYRFPMVEGISVIENTVSRLRTIEGDVGNKNYFELRLFTHYPTFAIIIVDEDIYTFPYGFRTIGTISPTLHVRGFNSLQAKFYRNQFDLLLKVYERT